MLPRWFVRDPQLRSLFFRSPACSSRANRFRTHGPWLLSVLTQRGISAQGYIGVIGKAPEAAACVFFVARLDASESSRNLETRTNFGMPRSPRGPESSGILQMPEQRPILCYDPPPGTTWERLGTTKYFFLKLSE